jgi:hypothetical protein
MIDTAVDRRKARQPSQSYKESRGFDMTKTLHGKVHGRTIELDEDPGVAEGQQVVITIKTLPLTGPPSTEGLQRSAGALAATWTEEDDRILEEIHQERKRDTRKDIRE